MTVATTYEHIVLDPAGVPMIEDTTTKVVEIVMEVKAYGWSPEEIHYQHPYLSLGQIYSALAYYWDNALEIDRDIKARMEKSEALKLVVVDHSIRRKLTEKGIA